MRKLIKWICVGACLLSLYSCGDEEVDLTSLNAQDYLNIDVTTENVGIDLACYFNFVVMPKKSNYKFEGWNWIEIYVSYQYTTMPSNEGNQKSGKALVSADFNLGDKGNANYRKSVISTYQNVNIEKVEIHNARGKIIISGDSEDSNNPAYLTQANIKDYLYIDVQQTGNLETGQYITFKTSSKDSSNLYSAKPEPNTYFWDQTIIQISYSFILGDNPKVWKNNVKFALSKDGSGEGKSQNYFNNVLSLQDWSIDSYSGYLIKNKEEGTT